MSIQCCQLEGIEKFTRDVVVQNRLNAKELNHYSEKEHISFLHTSILGGINCCVSTGEKTNYAKKEHGQKTHGRFYFQSRLICKDFYLFLHSVSDKVYCSFKWTLK